MTNPTHSNLIGSFVWYDQMSNDLAGAEAFYTKVVGWTLGETMETHLVTDAAKMALARRSPGAGLIVHSDRGRGRSRGCPRKGRRCAARARIRLSGRREASPWRPG